MRRLVPWLLLLALSGPLGAGPHDSGTNGPSEVLLRAMTDEMHRTLERLHVEGLARPHFVAYTAVESREYDVQATFGALERSREVVRRKLQAEVRVGSREFNDAHFVPADGRDFAPVSASLPVEDDYDALRNEIWALTDTAYKHAVERLALKKVYREAKNVRDVLPDLVEEPVRSFRETRRAPLPDREAWRESMREVSAVFRGFPEIQTSSAELEFELRHRYFVDSEGRSFVKPTPVFEIVIEARAQAADGMVESDERQILGRALEDLPSLEAMKREARQLAEDITALARAPRMETYLGPVLLEGQAAGEFFTQLLASGLAGPREPWVERSWAEKYYGAGALTGRLGLRVISPLFDVVDDPTAGEHEGRPLLGHYTVDDQGVPAQRVNLVSRGILRDLLMSRSPDEERKRSNGHGRGGFSAPPAAVIGNLILAASETVPLDSMKARLREEAEAFGLDRGLLIRRISDEGEQDEEELLSAPVLVYEIDVATGMETLVRDVRFSEVTLRSLRDIIAASASRDVHNLIKSGPYRTSPGAVSSIVHPSAVLVAEMELTETDRKPSQPPYLKHPSFE